MSTNIHLPQFPNDDNKNTPQIIININNHQGDNSNFHLTFQFSPPKESWWAKIKTVIRSIPVIKMLFSVGLIVVPYIASG